MTSTSNPAACMGTEEEPIPEFRIAILYETKALGIAAMHLCERLRSRFEQALPFHVTVESFQSLELEERFNHSLHAAAGSDMVMVGSAGGFPTVLRRWLIGFTSSRQPDAPVALVDLTAQGTANAARIHRFLREMAETNRVDLFSRELSRLSASKASCRSARSPAQNCRHWGINE